MGKWNGFIPFWESYLQNVKIPDIPLNIGALLFQVTGNGNVPLIDRMNQNDD